MAIQVKREDKMQEVYEKIQTKFEAYTGEEPYLFVSYSHRDTAKVYPILDALYDKKYRLWYDESCETGNDFRDELRTRIEKSEILSLKFSSTIRLVFVTSSYTPTVKNSFFSSWKFL